MNPLPDGSHVPRYRLVLLRHGESTWNALDLFTGWVNAGLSAHGEKQAAGAGNLLASDGLRPDVVHTSLQRRTIRTAELALAHCDREWIPVRRSWRLNSNHYGALQGRRKAEVRAAYGEEQYMAWRRGYDARPPLLEPGADHSQFADPRYAALPPEARPRGESLRDVTARLLPYWYDAIVPDLRAGSLVLVVSHGNTLRALIKHLESVSDDASAALNVPNAVPLRYELGDDLRPRHEQPKRSHARGRRDLRTQDSGCGEGVPAGHLT
jgi:2,3-bisphosphoglycerate-dependent phosphoglycerate mutase